MAKLQPQTADGYRPALDEHARRLIARIQRDPADTAAVLALKAHYEAHGDLPSLANLLEGWAQTLREPDAAADAYLAAAEAVLTAASDRARARWLCKLALERSPRHPLARARLEVLERAAVSKPPPPPPPRASSHRSGSKPPHPVSGIRSVDGSADWLEDDDVKLLDERAPSRTSRYEETQRIWRPQLS